MRRSLHPAFAPFCLLAALLLIATVACSGGSSSPTETVPPGPVGAGDPGANDDGGTGTGGDEGDDDGTPSGIGSLVIEMTDAPIEDIAELWVYVSGLKLKPAGGPVVRLREPELVPGLYDLLNLRNGISVILADAMIEATTYQFIEIELDQSRSYLVEIADPLVQVPMQIPSNKAKLNGGPFDVLPDGTTTVLFDFDAARSLHRKGNGEYQLKPFLQILEVEEEPSRDG